MKPFTLPKQLQSLTDEQLTELHDWLDDPALTYKEIRQKLLDTYALKISDATLSRYNARRTLADSLIDRKDTAQNIRAFLALQNAEPIPFDQAGLALVQERAFDLASAHKINASTLATLQHVFHYNTARADYERRHAHSEKRLLQTDRRNEIADRAVKVREEELADRRALGAAQAKSNSALSSRHSPLSDALGPLIRKPEDILARATKKFGTPSLSTSSPDPNPTLNPTLTLNPNPTLNPDLLSPPLSPFPPVQCPAENLRSGICDLQSKVDSYTVQRAEEYWAWRELAANLPVGQKPPPFMTAHHHCPCGQPNPCPQHESEPFSEFPTFFWSISPHLGAYQICLTARNLPYRDPYESVPEQFRIYDKHD